MVDWSECKKTLTAKEVKIDKNLISSTREIAESKVRAAESLKEEFYISKISLLYDALREYLEAIALENGYKIYNHECYTAFLKEILNLSREAHLFDELRKVRNSINYYGRAVNKDEAKKVASDLHFLISKFKQNTSPP